MPSKLNLYTAMFDEEAKRLSGDVDYFKSYLTTSARMYKYSFKDQVMIHAQRPNAVACAEYDTWGREDITNRYVKRGSKGIALIDDTSAKTRLRYVFDFADTGARDERSKEPFFWKITPETERLVADRLGAESPDLITALRETARTLAKEKSDNFLSQLMQSKEDSFLEELDDLNVKVRFEALLETSIAYSLFSRCGYEADFLIDDDDFMGIFEFNTIEAMSVLGAAVSELSEQALRNIEITLKDYERNKNYERNDITENNGRERDNLHLGRENGNLSSAARSTGGTPHRQVRNASQNLSEGELYGHLSSTSDVGQAERTSDGDRRNGSQTTGRDNSSDETGTRSNRADEVGQSDEVGRNDEQHSELSGGDNSQRTDLQLSDNVEILETLEGDLTEQIEAVSEHSDTALALPENIVFGAIKNTDGLKVTKEEVLSVFLEHESPEERAEFLKSAYPDRERSFYVEGELVNAVKSEDGLTIKCGEAENLYSWDIVQSVVADLIDRHEYLEAQPQQLGFFDIDPDIEETGGYENIENMQLSLFGDVIDEPKKKSGRPTQVGGMNVEEALRDEIMRGSGFADGKFRIDRFYRDNSPDTKEFADFLKHEYGTGGHSGEGCMGFCDHDSKGLMLRFRTEDGEVPVSFNWNEVAKATADLIKSHSYITADDIDSRIKGAKFTIAFANHDKDDFAYKKAVDVLVQYGLHDKNAELSAEMYDTDNPDVFKIREGAYLVNVEVTSTIEMWERFKACGIEPKTEAENKIMFETDGDNWLRFYIPDQFGNKTNSVDARDVCTPEEMAVLKQIIAEIVPTAEVEKAAVDEIIESADEELFSATFDEHLLNVGDVIEMDEGLFKVTDIKEDVYGTRYELQDLTDTGWFPIFRNISEEDLYEVGFSLVNEKETEKPAVKENTQTPVPEQEKKTAEPVEKHDFTITDANLGVGGAKAKFRANMEAIKLLNELEFDGRFATPEEQEVLSRYVGWGGLAQAFDENNDEWATEFMEVYEALSPDEYESARASTLNAHYTSPTVINAIYEGLENLGFTSGNVLEPAMGVGNFFGTMPEAMRDSKLYGVELDSISGRIAKQLYQTADIQVTGFEKTTFPDNFFDIAVGNVPFGSYKLAEKRYDKLNLNIHDHFFAKALDKVRAGGVVAFVTSKGTLDKENSKFREYLAQRADLLGAIRLPNNAFKANAGTEVTSDIIFLQKRDKIVDIEAEWTKLGQTADGVPVNKYFEEHPEMILGQMKQGVEFSMYGNATETACVPLENADLKAQLKAAIANIKGQIPEIEAAEIADGKAVESIPADPNVRNFSFAVVDDKVYFRENSRMNRVELPKATEDRVKGMVAIRDCVRKLIDLQLNEYSDSDIQSEQFKLNRLYDDFTKKFGLISSTANSRAFAEDSSYHLLTSLEVLNEQGELERKADMFTKRTIKQKAQIESVDTASEALAVSISEKACVDMPFMEKLSGKTEQQLYEDLQGVIFLNPLHGFGNTTEAKYVTADEYLSGNIRQKLEVAERTAELYPEDYAINVDALKKAMPTPLEASEIDVRLGATWIDTDTVKQFMCELLQVPRYLQNMVDVNFSKFTSEWQIDGKNVDRSGVMANMTYGTARKNAYSIIEDTLNLRDARVYDRVEQPDGKVTSVLNKKETMIAQEKQEAIKQAFKDWIFKDPERRETLVNKYNELFNSTRPREYDGSHITFSGMSPEIQLRPHQLNAIAHTMYGGNTLLAHQVGAGKTFEMVASAMESKRLGLCTKSLFVVPNHLTEQMGAEFLRLYPAANILVATKKDFEAKNRKRLCSKIATGDYDAVIVGHSQLEKIPVSAERQERMIRRQIEEITEGIESLGKSQGARFSVKQLEKTKRNLEAKLKKLTESTKRDDVVTFEELGVDKLFVDEAHSFKNLFLYTKMRNVAGIQQTEAQKSADLYMKCQYLDELTGGKGVVFATGTPVSNSMTELYTMMRYLQADKLKEMGMHNFDAWAANFGEAVTAIELAPEGTGYRAKTRFSKFFNLPELMNVFKEAADIKTADMLNLPVPEAHFHNIVVKPTETQKDMVADLSERAKKIHDKMVDPTEDNMLKVTNDGRKIGLDQRLINPLLADEPCSKVNACVNNVFDIYDGTSDKKSTQLVFCDFSTPKNDGTFNLYDDIRDKLVAKGVPKEEIAFIHEADTEVKKKELFAKVRQGKVRVLLGSTAKCGAGTNIQDKLVALHHLDCPWRPSDLEQREGRIIRQGNENKEVDVYRYMTEATFDAYLYQTIENKQRFISQICPQNLPSVLAKM